MTKIEEYLKWIAENVTEKYGRCKEVTDKMKEVFPELQQIRGHYYCFRWGERAHWWLTDEDGTIIDPTKEQFPSKGNGPYEPWIEGSPEPTGKCPNCGELIYHGGYTCNESCHNAYVAYCTSF